MYHRMNDHNSLFLNKVQARQKWWQVTSTSFLTIKKKMLDLNGIFVPQIHHILMKINQLFMVGYNNTPTKKIMYYMHACMGN